MNTLLEFIKTELLSEFVLKADLIRSKSIVMREYTMTECGDTAEFTYAVPSGEDKYVLTARTTEDTVILGIDAELRHSNGVASGFVPECALTFSLGGSAPDKAVVSSHDTVWWMYPSFIEKFEDIPQCSQSLLMKKGSLHYHVLPLTGENFRTELNGARLEITSDMSGLYHLYGDFLAVTVSDDPLLSVENNYKNARKLGAIRVPLKDERELPEFAHKLGWCTWDAFYKKLSPEKIFSKLDEFKEKNIPVKWVIIDDGWMSAKGSLLSAFEADKEKFPEGLAPVIRKMKSEYGIEKVGIWHAFNGYWLGVDTESELYEKQKDNLFLTPSGLALPSLDEDKAFKFWDAWHTYLENEGVDFLKVDNQSNNSLHLIGAVPTAKGCRTAHNSLERSIKKHFSSAVINCMGMDEENVLSRPMSAISRNSDDFFPTKERGFIKHLIQNVYNAIWHNQIYYCDFDMWWSNHEESAVQSGALRAISGSPIYVSDKVGDSNRGMIIRTVANDGKVMLCDHASLPTLDCIYTDCVKEEKLQKVWNRSGDNFAVAAFNVNENAVCDVLDLGAVPQLSKNNEYIAYEFFEKKFTRVTAESRFEVTLPKDGVAVWSLYPIAKENGREYIMLGDTDKYVPIAQSGEKTDVSSVLQNNGHPVGKEGKA